MTKSALVKIGVPSAEAQGIKQTRRLRQILEQEDAAIMRIRAATWERIRAMANESLDGVESANEEPAPVEETA